MRENKIKHRGPVAVVQQETLHFIAEISSGGSSLQHLEGHGHIASTVARVYNGGLGAELPAGSRGRAPGQGDSPRPLKLKHFWFLNVQWKPQICPLFYNLETQEN